MDLKRMDPNAAIALAAMTGGPTLGQFGRSHPRLVQRLASLDPLAAATNFAGMLTRPEIRASSLRLEILVALAVRHGNGDQRPTRETLSRAFKEAGAGWAGRAEDPAEDVVVARVTGERGDFSILPGLAEGAADCLDRFLDVVDHMPDGSPWDALRDEVYALLALSHEAIRRSGMAAHDIGAELPVRTLPAGVAEAMPHARAAVTFTQADLARLGIRASRLAPFVFDMRDRSDLDLDPVNMTRLERQPLLSFGDGIALALPTAVSLAARMRIIDFCLAEGFRQSLEANLARSYSRLLHHMSILGGPSGALCAFRTVSGERVASFSREVDRGRWLQVVARVDDLDGYETDGFLGANPSPDRTGRVVLREIENFACEASARDGFRDGVALVVSCGWGRGFALGLRELPRGWRVASLSAHDLRSLSEAPSTEALDLWRLLDMRDAVSAHGVSLLNPNGLLNLAALARKNDGHVIPHAQLPLDLRQGAPLQLWLEQNALLGLRREAAMARDRRTVPGPDGRPIRVERSSNGPGQGGHEPHYASPALFRVGRANGAVLTGARAWWVLVTASDGSSTDGEYQHWEMAHHWLGEAAPVLEEHFPGLPPGTITWELHFDGLATRGKVKAGPALGDDPEAVAATLSWEAYDQGVRVRATADFQRAHQHVSNVAERTLVKALVAGTATLAGLALEDEELQALVGRIVPDADARHIHHLPARGFRDEVAHTLRSGFVAISEHDVALHKLGSAARAGHQGGGKIVGVRECLAFLNGAAAQAERELCEALRGYGRTPFLLRVIENYEAAVQDRTLWQRTARSVLSQRRRSGAAYTMIADREGRRNGVMQASRILLEAGLCECAPDEGNEAGDLELSRLMVIANSIVATGGWSNAIRWGAMDPVLTISPLGDVLAGTAFDKEVMTPFGQASTRVMTDNAAARYSDLFASPGDPVDPEDLFDPAFLDAWREETGLSLDATIDLLAAVEEHFLGLGRAAGVVTRGEFFSLITSSGCPEADAHAFLGAFALPSRQTWFDVPDGFAKRDREAWRYRRRLSVLRRPILAAGEETLVVAPGMVREALEYLLRNFRDGAFDKTFAGSTAMRSWIGETNNRRGHAFNAEVAGALGMLGWRTEPDLKVTALLRKGFPRDYGDIDVLAWHPAEGRVLLVECKDLHFRKTMGEIAEHLADFRGGTDENGRPDRLRRHLDRHAVIKEHREAVMKFTGLPGPVRIECHVVFRDPVPVAVRKGLVPEVRMTLFADLATI